MEKEAVWATLANREPPKINGLVSQLMLRARFNPQRHYEIYFVGGEDGITEQDIRDMFRRDPQGSAELIREKGECFYSNRAEVNRTVIV